MLIATTTNMQLYQVSDKITAVSNCNQTQTVNRTRPHKLVIHKALVTSWDRNQLNQSLTAHSIVQVVPKNDPTCF